jgi:hypothetical protein
MKKFIIALLTVFVFSLAITRAEAATATPTANPSPSASQVLNEKLDKEINQLKEKIASHVAQLNLVEKRGILGNVAATSNNQVTITDISGNTRFVDVDELTKFSSPSDKSFGLSDLTKGTKVTVLGLYNKQSERILARFIDVSVDPTFLSGAVADIDTKNGMLTLSTEDKKQIKIDVQTTTKISQYTSSDGTLSKYGLSKMNVGDRVTIVGFPEKQDQNIISPTRIIDYTDLPKDPLISLQQPSNAESSANLTATLAPAKKTSK